MLLAPRGSQPRARDIREHWCEQQQKQHSLSHLDCPWVKMKGFKEAWVNDLVNGRVT